MEKTIGLSKILHLFVGYIILFMVLRKALGIGIRILMVSFLHFVSLIST